MLNIQNIRAKDCALYTMKTFNRLGTGEWGIRLMGGRILSRPDTLLYYARTVYFVALPEIICVPGITVSRLLHLCLYLF